MSEPGLLGESVLDPCDDVALAVDDAAAELGRFRALRALVPEVAQRRRGQARHLRNLAHREQLVCHHGPPFLGLGSRVQVNSET